MEKPAEVTIGPNRQHLDHPIPAGRLVLLALEEILGQTGVNEVLQYADLSEDSGNIPLLNQQKESSLTHLNRLQTGLERTYGPQAGRGLALRLGQAWFRHGLRTFGTELGLNQQDFRLLPLQVRLKTSLEIFANLFNTQNDQRIHLERDEKYIFWNMERCPLCSERKSETPCCHLAVGFLQEALYWVSGGKLFDVEEMKCIAQGDNACIIRINRFPLA